MGPYRERKISYIPYTWNHEQDEGCRCEHPCDITSLEYVGSAERPPSTRLQTAYIVVNIEILDQRIPTSRYRLIVRDLSRVVESVQVDSASHGARHHENTVVVRPDCVDRLQRSHSSADSDCVGMRSRVEMKGGSKLGI